MTPLLRCEDYVIAWIAILPVEVEAAVAVLDRLHDGHFESTQSDDYTYIAGEINGHNVVIAKPPAGQIYGPGTAAALALHVKTRFHIWFALLVGVAAGLPDLSTKDSSRRRDIRLGDVLVCVPEKNSTGLVHYDLGTDTEAGFIPNGRQAETPPLIRSAIGSIQVLKKRPFRAGNDLAVCLDRFYAATDDDKFKYPGQDQDELLESCPIDSSGTDGWIVVRRPRDEAEPTQVWYGKIGSGGTVMRNAHRRDSLRDEYNLIGLEMEAAGIMNILPTGIIRGVCDYGDAYKTKLWQPYAAAVAAVYAKGILREIRPRAVTVAVRAPPALKLPGKPNPTAYRYPLPRDRKSYFGKQLKGHSGRFSGRSDILDLLEAVTKEDETSESRKIVALSGFGGIGKTEILLEYGLMACRSNNIFFCQASQGQSFESCIATLANTIGSEVLDGSIGLEAREQVWNRYGTAPRVEAFIRWLQSGPEGSSLILFDDVDAFRNENDHQSLSAAIRSWPHTVLLTTRNPNFGENLAAESSRESKTHCIEALSDEELIPIMEQFVNQRLHISAEDLAIIAKLMEGHVMAACRAVQFISQVLIFSTEDPVRCFINCFENANDNFGLREEFMRFQPHPGRSLAMCFETSIQRLGGLKHIATRVLGFASYLSGPDIDFRLIIQQKRPWLSAIAPGQHFLSKEILLLSDAEFRQVLNQLVATSALIWIGSKLTVHRLMQEFLFHKHGAGGRINILRQIMLLAGASFVLNENLTLYTAVVRRCKAIAKNFGIQTDDISPPQEMLDVIQVHTLPTDVQKQL